MAKNIIGTHHQMNLNRINNLLDQIIEKAKQDDANFRKENVCGNAQRTVGESWMVFHLKNLKQLIKAENEKKFP